MSLEVSPKTKFSFNIKTMGCKSNIYDSLIMEKELRDLGGTPVPSAQGADLYILNSCTVTEEADKQALKEIKSIELKTPSTLRLMTGCLAESQRDSLEKNESVQVLLDLKSKQSFREIVRSKLNLAEDHKKTEIIDDIFWGQLPTEGTDKTRSFLKIQEGCGDFCTYCIIPYGRGESRSVPRELILNEVRRLSESGIQEIILTGTNLADYGQDRNDSLEELIEAIFKETPLARLRVSSLDPTEITDQLLSLMRGYPHRFMPHLHVSLQSASTAVLRGMKRHYTSEKVIECLNKIYSQNPNIFVGMDVIAGFPSETREHHEDTLKILRETPWSRLHVFPYSPRKGTPATRIPGLARIEERKRRAKELVALSNQRHRSFLSQYIDKEVSAVLLETHHRAGFEDYVIGYSPNYCRILAKTDETSKSLRNKTGTVKVLGLKESASLEMTLEGVLL